MGFIVSDTITFNGLPVSNFIVSIGGRFRLYKFRVLDQLTTWATAFRLEYDVMYYANDAMYQNNNPFKTEGLLSIPIDPSLITTDIFTYIYTQLKQKYQQTSDN